MIRKRNTRQQNIEDIEIELGDLTADDLAIYASGFIVLGNFFTFLSLIKVREENEAANKLNQQK